MIIPRYLTRTQDRVSDLFILDQPTLLKRTTQLKNVKLSGKSNLNCKLESQWLSVSRQVSQKKAGIEVNDILAVKKPLIPNSELQTKEFVQFQEKLEDCLNNVAVIFKP
jgi:hypothetical protein